MREYLKSIGTAVLPLVVTTAAVAADLGPYRQVFEDAPVAPRAGIAITLGVNVGPTIANTELSIPGFSLDGIGSQGVIGGVHANLDYITASRWFFGLYGMIQGQSTDTTITLGGTSFNVDFDTSYAIGGRVGYDWGLYRAYGLFGWRHTDLDWPTGVIGVPSSLSGFDLGAGAGIMLTNHIELGVEIIHTRFDDERIGGPGGLNLSTDQLQGLLKLSYRF